MIRKLLRTWLFNGHDPLGPARVPPFNDGIEAQREFLRRLNDKINGG